MQLHISFQPERVFSLFGQDITNSLFTALVIIPLLFILIVFIKTKLNTYKPGTLELMLETIHEALFGLLIGIFGEPAAKKYFALLLTFFVFILFSNWFPIMPGVSSLAIVHEEESSIVEYAHEQPVVASTDLVVTGVEEKADFACLLKGSCYLTSNGIVKGESQHLFRAPTADLSATLMLALLSVVVTNIIGFKAHKIGYLKKYINFKGPIDAFVGVLELISELGKMVSFSFRLFGNIFAGEVLLLVVTSISFGLITFPFLGLELFVGVIQALVFFMLTAVFIGLALQHHE